LRSDASSEFSYTVGEALPSRGRADVENGRFDTPVLGAQRLPYGEAIVLRQNITPRKAYREKRIARREVVQAVPGLTGLRRFDRNYVFLPASGVAVDAGSHEEAHLASRSTACKVSDLSATSVGAHDFVCQGF
jgi:hypothetical protein